MRKNKSKIPVNTMDSTSNLGISIDRNYIDKSSFETAQQAEEAAQAHRDAGYTFHILEKGKVVIQIDFKIYHLVAPAVVYLHPDQVHQMMDIDDILVSTLSLSSEHLNPEYLEILEDLNPGSPLLLETDPSSVISNSFSLCLKFYREKDNNLYYPLLRDSCNTLCSLLLS
ncbi:MAG: AraC family transcriptional regulator, partial [Chryseobacterium sp.]